MVSDEFTPITFEEVKETKHKPFTDHFPKYDKGLIRVLPNGYIQHPAFATNRPEALFCLKPKPDDVWLRTFPRSGTTWTSELLWLLVNGCDFDAASKTPLDIRTPNIDVLFMNDWENDMSTSTESVANMLSLPERIDKMPAPRVIKTHQMQATLHPDLLNTCKNVYVVRNPKDVITSYYFLHKLIKICEFTGTMEQFAEYFMDDKLLFSPYFAHVLEGWSHRNHPNMLFLFYEELKKDLRGQIKRVATFLNKKLTEEQLTRLTDHLRFAAFEKNESVNLESVRREGIVMNNDKANIKFVRKGKTGDWKNHFGPEMNQRIDDWMAKNLAETDLTFVTELDHQD